ncbi:hypothetical protein HY227_01475 [Candidatus Wolfebacteria bacterium]|nr:hypothetical protein [Candidatus Wolfebacteria bacterium]
MAKAKKNLSFWKELGRMFGLWNLRELQRARWGLMGLGIILVVFIIPGAFLGGVGFKVKLAVLEIGLILALVFGLLLFLSRAALGVEIAAILKKNKNFRKKPAEEIEAAAESYIRLAAGILCSIIAAGLIAVWLPAHKNPLFAVLFLLAMLVFCTYTVWRKGKVWWPKVILGLAVATLLISLSAIYLPKKTEAMIEKVNNLEKPAATAATTTTPVPPTFQEFHLNAGEKMPTVHVEKTARVHSNKPWAIAGISQDYDMPAEWSSLQSQDSDPGSLTWVKGKENGTTLKIYK